MPHNVAPSVSAEQNIARNDSNDQGGAKKNAGFSSRLLSHVSLFFQVAETFGKSWGLNKRKRGESLSGHDTFIAASCGPHG